MLPISRPEVSAGAGGTLRGCALALCFLSVISASGGGANSALPPFVDNSLLRYFPAVFNQGANNACSQAAGVRYAFTYEVNRILDRDASLPENVFAYHFTWNFLNEGENQGSHAFLGYDLMKECGAVPLTVFDDQPYSHPQQTRWLSGFDTYINAMKFRVDSYRKISLKTLSGIDSLRRYLHDHDEGSAWGGVATVSCHTDDWGYRRYEGPRSSDIRYMITREGSDGPHAITITGYDDTFEYDFDNDGIISANERGAFIFVNSWGDFWGSEGKCYLPYSVVLADNAAGGLKETDAEAYIVTPLLSSPSGYVFRVALSYDRRQELSFIVGVADGNDSPTALKESIPRIMCNQGGNYPMQGEGADKYMEVAFRSDYLQPFIEGCVEPKFFFSVRRTAAKGSGELASFSVVDLASGNVFSYRGDPVPLSKGLTTVSTGPAVLTLISPRSPWKWLREGTKIPYTTPYVVRTANGQIRKMKVRGYDSKKGVITISHKRL